MAAPTALVLTSAEQREYDDLLKRGYRDIIDAPREIRVGARVRHRGEQYMAAVKSGTGFVVAVMEKTPSAWVSAGWGPRDIELIVRTDQDRHGTGRLIGCWADYHTVVIKP